MAETKVVSVHGMPPDLAAEMRTQKLDATLVDVYSEAVDNLTMNVLRRQEPLQGPAACKGAKIYPVRIRADTYERAQEALEHTRTRLSAFLRTAVYRYLRHQ